MATLRPVFSVVDGPYVEANWPVLLELAGPSLRRRFGVFEILRNDGSVASQALSISDQTEVDTVLALTEYDSPDWNTQADGFRRAIEGWNPPPAGALTGSRMHNIVHLWVGGMWVEDIGGGVLEQRLGSIVPATSPNDPIFFLHHCFIDKLWADWQDARAAAALADYPRYAPRH